MIITFICIVAAVTFWVKRNSVSNERDQLKADYVVQWIHSSMLITCQSAEESPSEQFDILCSKVVDKFIEDTFYFEDYLAESHPFDISDATERVTEELVKQINEGR